MTISTTIIVQCGSSIEKIRQVVISIVKTVGVAVTVFTVPSLKLNRTFVTTLSVIGSGTIVIRWLKRFAMFSVRTISVAMMNVFIMLENGTFVLIETSSIAFGVDYVAMTGVCATRSSVTSASLVVTETVTI